MKRKFWAFDETTHHLQKDHYFSIVGPQTEAAGEGARPWPPICLIDARFWRR